jgi:putative oxidoreductase
MAHGYPKLFGGPEKEPPQSVTEALGPNFAPAVKQGGPESFAQALAQMGVPEPQVAAVLAGLAEFGGGLGLALGLGTRPAGFVASANMAVAARKAHWPQGFYGQGGYEFPLLLGLVAAALALTGPGAISFDRLLGRD